MTRIMDAPSPHLRAVSSFRLRPRGFKGEHAERAGCIGEEIVRIEAAAQNCPCDVAPVEPGQAQDLEILTELDRNPDGQGERGRLYRTQVERRAERAVD